MEVIHAVAAAQHGPAGAKNIPSKANARIVKKQSATRTGKRGRGVGLIPFDAGENSAPARNGSALVLSVEAWIPRRKSIAGGIHPRTQMREAHAVVQGQTARNL